MSEQAKQGGELDQREHERLCAYACGEMDGQERAAFERELAASPRLRAEHARLVRTLEVVAAAGSEPLALSEPARDELVASAAGARGWSARSTMRFAAAAGIAAAVLFVVRLARPGASETRRAAKLVVADALEPECVPAPTEQEPEPTERMSEAPQAGLAFAPSSPSAPGLVLDPTARVKLETQLAQTFAPPALPRVALGEEPRYSYYTWRDTWILPEPLAIPPLEPGTATINGGQFGVFGAIRAADPGLQITDCDTITFGLPQFAAGAQIDSVLAACRVASTETPRDMYFRFWGDNAFVDARADRLSTFAIDQDTASYALARGYLSQNQLPPPASVRTEEFVNAFRPYVDAPQSDTFALSFELAPSRFPTADPASLEFAPAQRWMLSCSVRGREVALQERTPLNLTFVVDTSGSMREGNRLDLVKHTLGLLAEQLFPTDRVALVSFAQEARVVLAPTPMANRAAFEGALSALAPEGGTNAEAGLVLGYAQAEGMLDPRANNRVVLCSDGVANIGATEQAVLGERVKSSREKGIFLNTVGVGMGNHNDALLEQLADRGDGVCRYVDSAAEAKRVMVDELTGTLETIARDVKLQVEFDAEYVARWRQLGYENRAVAAGAFRDDRVDAGEAQAGRQTTALYELDLAGAPSGDPLIGTLRVRWQPTQRGGAAQERALPIRLGRAAWTFAAASAGFRRSALVAQAAEVLRGSVHARGDSLDELVAECERLALELRDPSFDEFVGLVRRARELALARRAQQGELERLTDELRENSVRRQVIEQQARERQWQELEELAQRSRDLEARIQVLLEAARAAGNRGVR